MSNARMSAAYFEWLINLAGGDKDIRRRPMRKLLLFLYETEFVYIMDMDANRAIDGVDLRYRFAYESGRDTQLIAKYVDEKPCSVLEMMIALSVRCEDNIMEDIDFGNRTGLWFWTMIGSLGFSSYEDSRFDRNIAEAVVTKFLRREHSPDGRGGLFTVPNCPKDLRNIEIWYQMMWYLDTLT